ncbi:MAG: BON domain-containing protein [Terracidiphilus sp.]|jgi:osmotically-inducible protein OsmY
MNTISRTLMKVSAVVVLTCSLGYLPARGQEPDNSAQNKAQSTTADDQANAKTDRLTTAKIRKAIIADKNLSTYAHNVKIITRGGQVTLKGPVKSEDEKQQVLTDATSVVPTENISNELTVKE